MSDNEKINIQNSSRMIGGVTLLIIMFWGEPDLLGSIINYLVYLAAGGG